VRALRWQYLFPAQTRPRYGPVLAATLLGQFFNNVLPARAGEAARVIALNRSSGTAATEVVATVVHLVNSGTVRLVGNFRGARFDLDGSTAGAARAA
jgi:uncharacterized membrane protein YbhN (UPF0104 family)